MTANLGDWMKKCKATCENACGCLCDRTPGAAVPVQWPPHDGRVSQLQCDRGPVRAAGLEAWHDAQEQEVEDAAWRDARARTVLRVVAGALILAGMFAIYWGTK